MSAQPLISLTQAEMPSLIPGLKTRDPVFLADMRTLWGVLYEKWTHQGDLAAMTESVRSAMRVHPGQTENIRALASWFAYLHDTGGLGELEADWSRPPRAGPVHISELIPAALGSIVSGPQPTPAQPQPPSPQTT